MEVANLLVEKGLIIVHNMRRAKVLAIGPRALDGEILLHRLLANREGANRAIERGRDGGDPWMPPYLPPDEIARRTYVDLWDVAGKEEELALIPRDEGWFVGVVWTARPTDEPPRPREDKGRQHVVGGGVVVGHLD